MSILPSRKLAAALPFVLLVVAPVWANVGPPNLPGRIAGEPTGIENIAIEHEKLTIDLRPLTDDGAVRVEAIYHLNNTGPARTQDLLFVMGSKAEDFRVFLDDQPLQATPAPDAQLPRAWKAPKQTPSIPGRRTDTLVYQTGSATPMAFTVTISPGRHSLRARIHEPGRHAPLW